MDTKAAATKAKKIAFRLALATVLLGSLGAAGYTYFVVHFSYSEGERVGFVQKLSKKGWICKTDEGELAMVNMPGQSAQIFAFTVRNDAITAQIDALAGHRVSLKYEEHRGIPSSCFGETETFVVGVRKAD